MSKIVYILQNQSGSNGSYYIGDKQFTILPGEVIRLNDKPIGTTVNIILSRITVEEKKDDMKPLHMIPVEDNEEEEKSKDTEDSKTTKK